MCWFSTLSSVWKFQIQRGGTVSLRLWCAGGRIRAAAKASWLLCEWKSQRHGANVCQCDGVHSATAKQILHSQCPTKQSYRNKQHECGNWKCLLQLMRKKKNSIIIHGKVSVIPSILLILCHISAQKNNVKKCWLAMCSFHCCVALVTVWKKENLKTDRTISPSDRDFNELSPNETASSPQVRESDSIHFLLM